MNRPETPQGPPLPLPPRDADVTLLQRGTLPPPPRPPAEGAEPPPLPDAPAVTPRLLGTATGARVAVPAVQNSSVLNQKPRLDLQPAPAARLPMMPPHGANTNSTLAGQHHAIAAPRPIDPGLLRPIRPPDDATRPPLGKAQESSDVLQTFEVGPDDAHPGMPYPAVAQKTIPPGSGLTIPPPGKLLRHGPPALAHGKGQALRAVPPAPVAYAPGPSPAPGPQVLPLETERVVELVREHRRQLRALDLWARGLEIAAGVAAVALLVGVAVGAFAAAGGFALAAIALAAQATILRQVADNAARVAALLDALSGPRQGR